MTPEVVLRWGATVAALLALAGLAYVLGVSVSPALACGVVLAVAGALAVVLWNRHLEELRSAELRRAHAPEPFASPDTGKY